MAAQRICLALPTDTLSRAENGPIQAAPGEESHRARRASEARNYIFTATIPSTCPCCLHCSLTLSPFFHAEDSISGAGNKSLYLFRGKKGIIGALLLHLQSL
uniref:Uncharacterized protein n=1 Tax=Junco hyemalis TaxID=40217 RepID=A0A8C5IVN0_JUNHY